MVCSVWGLRQICHTNNSMYKNHLWLRCSYNGSLSSKENTPLWKFNTLRKGPTLCWNTLEEDATWLLKFLKEGRKLMCKGKFYDIYDTNHLYISPHFPCWKANQFSKSKKFKICIYELWNKLFPLTIFNFMFTTMYSHF